MKDSTKNYLNNLIERFPRLSSCRENLSLAIELLIHTYNEKNCLYLCGNGGSAADCLHIVGELMKSFVLRRPINIEIKRKLYEISPESADYLCEHLETGFSAQALLNETSLLSAYSNDKVADLCFAQQLLGLGSKGDVLLAISTSGNSSNVVYAAIVAKALEMKVIGLSGRTGGKLKKFCDVLITVPDEETYRIQELHLPIYHTLCLALEEEFFGGIH